MRLQITTDGPQQTMALARALAGCLRGGDLLALVGPLGSGKTCFVRGLALGLGIPEAMVSSPTFIICQEYAPPGDDPDAPTLAHVDVYRLADPSELETIGWEELLDAPNTVIAVEWADRINHALPAERIEVLFEHVDEDHRSITIAAPESMDPRLRELASQVGDLTAGRCPICGARVEPAVASYPFCSDRCRLADLGRWFDGDYRVTRPVGEGDLE